MAAGTLLVGGDFAGFTEGSSVITYGKPNQHKVWWNSAQSRWDGLIPDSTYDHFIFADITAGTADKRLELEDRSSGRVDCYWDDSAGKLYVASNHTSDPEFFRVDYTSGTDTYAMGAGAERAGEALHANFASDGSPDEDYTISVFKSVLEDDRVWVAILNPTGLHVGWSDDDGDNWDDLNQVELVTAPNQAGLTGFFEYATGGNNYIGVCGCENSGTPQGEGYCFTVDQATSSVNLRTAGNWTDESTNVSETTLAAAFPGLENDNHLCITQDANGKMYWISKTANGATTEPLLVVYERTAAGTWTGPTKVKDHTNDASRCSIAVDETNDEIYIFYTLKTPADQRGVYKKASTVAGLDAASETTIFEVASNDFSNLFAPCRPVTGTSNLMTVCGNYTTEKVYYNEIAIAAAASSIIPHAMNHYRQRRN